MLQAKNDLNEEVVGSKREGEVFAVFLQLSEPLFSARQIGAETVTPRDPVPIFETSHSKTARTGRTQEYFEDWHRVVGCNGLGA
jgi:hypothetical protein